MGDVEEMIGELEDEEDEEEEAPEQEEGDEETEEEEESFGLDLDSAWSSPERDD